LAQQEKPSATKRVMLIVAGVAAAMIAVAAVLAIHGTQTPPTSVASIAPSVALPGDDPTPVEQFAQQQAAQALSAVAGDTPAPAAGSPVAAEASSLQGMLPISLPGGFLRTVMTTSGSASGLGPASAEATYKRGEAQLRVVVADLGPLNAGMAVTGATITTIGGRTMVEDSGGGVAKYSIVGRDGALLTAEATSGATMEDAKAALTTIGIDRLEILAAR
jgi:hypothetical protein